MDKDNTLFSYQEFYGVHIRKVQFSSGIAGPKYCQPEDRRGNFRYLTPKQEEQVAKGRVGGYYPFNGFEAHGKEFPDPKDNAKYTWFHANIVLLVYPGEKGCQAIYPSGEVEYHRNKNWRPGLEDFKK